MATGYNSYAPTVEWVLLSKTYSEHFFPDLRVYGNKQNGHLRNYSSSKKLQRLESNGYFVILLSRSSSLTLEL